MDYTDAGMPVLTKEIANEVIRELRESGLEKAVAQTLRRLAQENRTVVGYMQALTTGLSEEMRKYCIATAICTYLALERQSKQNLEKSC